MKAQLIATAMGGVLMLAASAAFAQPPAGAPPAARPAPPPPAPLAVPMPHYDSVTMEVDVNRPAAAVWARVGKFCDIGEWFGGFNCALVSGQDGELGAVRQLNGSILEILVAKTQYSYTYAQPVRVGQFYPQYHGTIEARPMTSTTTKLIYSLFFDNSNMADDAARQKDRDNRRTRFMQGVLNMKILAEGGKLPPPAPPRAPGAPAGPPAAR